MTDPRDVVAAVCYRRRDAAIEFLLVQTNGGKRWTFPKGHVEAGERPAVAAAREAREEAGAEGAVSETAVARYASSRDEPAVTAFLLEVTNVGEQRSQDSHRERAWVGPQGAVDLLRTRRERTYADEHERVVREAVGLLEP
jgi:8-oxo-dGTP pyrophosphatase MutT (NUDIX family)